MGGRCIHDPQKAELGTVELTLTAAGREDPLFGSLPPVFWGQAGHEDCVTELPPGAILLASSERVQNQAFKLRGAVTAVNAERVVMGNPGQEAANSRRMGDCIGTGLIVLLELIVKMAPRIRSGD